MDEISNKTNVFTWIGFLVMLVGTIGAGLQTYLAYIQAKIGMLVVSSLGYLIVGAFIAQVIISHNPKHNPKKSSD